MFCKNCGTQVKDGAAFCSGCGKNIAAPANPNTTQPTQQPYQQPPVYSTPNGYRSAGNPNKKVVGWIEAAVISILSIIFMIGQFTFNMVKLEITDDYSKTYSFGDIAIDGEGMFEDTTTFFIGMLSLLCIIVSVIFLIIAFVRVKKHPASGCKFAAASLIPTIIARIGLLIEVSHLKNDTFGGDFYQLSGSVIFSIIFCIILFVATLVVTDSITE